MTAVEAYAQLQAETDQCYGLMADASVIPLDKQISRADFDALVSRNGNEIITIHREASN